MRRLGSRVALTVGVMIAWAGVSAAEETSLVADVDAREIGVEDQVRLEIRVSGRGAGATAAVGLPALKNLRLIGGPSVSTQVSFAGGAVSQSKTFTYVLQPLAEGRAEIGGLRIQLDGAERTTAPIEISVVAGSIRPRARPRQDPFGWDPFGGDPFGEDPFEGLFTRGRRAPARAAKIFVEAVVGRTRLYVGEPVLVTYNLYTQATVADLKFTEQPQYPGFWVEELPSSSRNIQGAPVTVEGERYIRFPAMQRLLFPTRAGRLTISAARIQVGLAQRSPFDPGPAAVERETKAITLDVQAIPETPGFSGAVGQFEARAGLDRASVGLGDAVTLRFSLSGRGNLKWIERGPDVQVVGAKVYPPQATVDVKVGKDGMSGKRTWEYVLVPETAGTLRIPELAVTYFDPGAGRLRDAAAPGLAIEVAGAGQGAGAGIAPERAVPSGESGGLALRTDLEREPLRAGLGPRTLALLTGVLLLSHALLWGFSRWRLGPTGVQSHARGTTRGHRRAALAEIARARGTAVTKEAAAALIEKALTDVFGPLEGASGDARAQAAREVLDEVRFLRFAPQLGDYSEKIRELAQRSAEVVRRHG